MRVVGALPGDVAEAKRRQSHGANDEADKRSTHTQRFAAPAAEVKAVKVDSPALAQAGGPSLINSPASARRASPDGSSP